MLITVFSISCKNKTTNMSEFGFAGSMEVNTSKNFTQFANSIFRSVEPYDSRVGAYLWTKFTDTGILVQGGYENSISDFSAAEEIQLAKSPLTNFMASFEGSKTGKVTFYEENATIDVSFTNGVSDMYKNKTIKSRLIQTY